MMINYYYYKMPLFVCLSVLAMRHTGDTVFPCTIVAGIDSKTPKREVESNPTNKIFCCENE